MGGKQGDRERGGGTDRQARGKDGEGEVGRGEARGRREGGEGEG